MKQTFLVLAILVSGILSSAAAKDSLSPDEKAEKART
jgi:hypothetical protein